MKKIFFLITFVVIHAFTFAQKVFEPEIITVKAKNGEEYEIVSIIGPKDKYQTIIEKIGWEERQEQKDKYNLETTESFYHQLPMLVAKEKDGLSELNRIKSHVLYVMLEYGLGDTEDMSKISYFAEELLAHKYLFMKNINVDNGEAKWLKNALPKLRGYWSDEKLDNYKKEYLVFMTRFVEANLNHSPKIDNASELKKELFLRMEAERQQNLKDILIIFNNL